MPATQAKTADEIQGLEYDWLACDADGCVALFSTAGGGYAPDEFLRETDAHEAAIEAVLAMPATTTVRFAPEWPPDWRWANTWRLVAERGLFAFDSDYCGGPYQLLAAPVASIRVGALPGDAAEVVRRCKLQRVRFASVTTIAPDLLRPYSP